MTLRGRSSRAAHISSWHSLSNCGNSIGRLVERRNPPLGGIRFGADHETILLSPARRLRFSARHSRAGVRHRRSSSCTRRSAATGRLRRPFRLIRSIRGRLAAPAGRDRRAVPAGLGARCAGRLRRRHAQRRTCRAAWRHASTATELAGIADFLASAFRLPHRRRSSMRRRSCRPISSLRCSPRARCSTGASRKRAAASSRS